MRKVFTLVLVFLCVHLGACMILISGGVPFLMEKTYWAKTDGSSSLFILQ